MWKLTKQYWKDMWVLLWSKTTVDDIIIAKAKEIQSKAIYGTSILGKYTIYKLTNNENPDLAFLCMILPLSQSVVFVKLSSTIDALDILEKEFDTFCSSFRKR